jgi:hypothetical protein
MSSYAKLYGQNLELIDNSGTSTDKQIAKSVHLDSGNYVIIPSFVEESKTENFLLLINSQKQIKSW